MDRPSPVPSPVGFVVKNGLNSFSFTSGDMPVPLSRILISTLLPRLLVGDQAVPIFRRIDEPDERCRRPLETADFPGTDLDVTLQ